MEERVGRRLRKLVDELTVTAKFVHDLKDSDDSRKVLQDHLNLILAGLQEVEAAASVLPETTDIPLDLVESLDQGRHPDLWFRRAVLERLQAGQRESRSKADALKEFHGLLAGELGWSPIVAQTLTDVGRDAGEEEELVVD